MTAKTLSAIATLVILPLSSPSHDALRGVLNFGRRPTPSKPQMSRGLELPSWGDRDFGHAEDMPQGLWPDYCIRYAELVILEDRLRYSEYEDDDERRRLSEAYDMQLCMLQADDINYDLPEYEEATPHDPGPKDYYGPDSLEEDDADDADTPPDRERRSSLSIPVGRDDNPKPDPSTPIGQAKPSKGDLLIHVELSKRRLTVKKGKKKLRTFEGIEYSRVGIGTKINSKRTPTGSFHVTKEARHRYGPVLRLSGYQGWSRGILIHQDNTRDGGSNGCLHVRNLKEMRELFDLVEDGTALLIER